MEVDNGMASLNLDPQKDEDPLKMEVDVVQGGGPTTVGLSHLKTVQMVLETSAILSRIDDFINDPQGVTDGAKEKKREESTKEEGKEKKKKVVKEQEREKIEI